MKEALLTLTPGELRDLAGALEAGRLGPPYTPLSLQQFVNRESADATATSLDEIARRGCTALAMARLLTLLAVGAEQRPLLEDVIDLVATGPGTNERQTRPTAVVVSDLFRGAEKSVIVAGYSVHQGQSVFRDLAQRMEELPGLQVSLYLDIQRGNGDTSLPDEIVRRFSYRFRATQWPPGKPLPVVYYDPRSVASDRSQTSALHAKCVIIDSRRLFVSSANFTEAAQQRNIEIGLLLDSELLASRIERFFSDLVTKEFLKRAV